VKVLGLIPARGGSKGIPGKNLRPLAGKPLIQWTHEAALASGQLDRIVLSTDDEAIANLGRQVGIDVPFIRPSLFATDDSPMIDVAAHAIETLAGQGYSADALLLLQPTSPMRRPEHIRKAISLLGDNDGVCSVTPVPHRYSPPYLVRIDAAGMLDFYLPGGEKYTRRQDVPAAYKRDGTIFLTRTVVLLEQRSFYGQRCVPMILREDEVLNIDDPEEWEDAERRLSPIAR
jgi:CMP-N,N'-diacetyllegionaminic acid synthase